MAGAEESLRDCFSKHNQCVSSCFSLDGEGTQATCVAQCAGVEAQCAGKIGISKSEPFIRKKAEQLEQLLDDFFNDILPVPKGEKESETQTNT